MHYDPRSTTTPLPPEQLHRCTGPRPLAWLSSVDGNGVVDLGVFPHWQWLSTQAPVLMFSAEQSAQAQRATAVRNAESSGWFVWNLATASLRDAVKRSAQGTPAGVDAFQHAGVAKAPSVNAACPRVAQSPMQLECRYLSTQRLPGHGPNHFVDLVLAEVVRVHLSDDWLAGAEDEQPIEQRALLHLSAEEWLELPISCRPSTTTEVAD